VGSFDLQPYENSPLFFTGPKLRPLGIGIEATASAIALRIQTVYVVHMLSIKKHCKSQQIFDYTGKCQYLREARQSREHRICSQFGCET